MNRATVVLMGCSSFLVLALLIGNSRAAKADSPQYEGFIAPGLNTSGNRHAQIIQPQVISTQYFRRELSAAIDPASDTVGDLAIARFGCDCPGCRNMAAQLLQTGRL